MPQQTFRPDTIITLRPATEETTLLPHLTASLTQYKRTGVKNLLKHGQIMVDGVVTRQFDTPVTPDTEVRVNLTRAFVVFYNRRLKIVYEDDDIIVVNKGYGLLSMGNDRVKDGTAYSILKEYLKAKDPRNKIFIVHRLDQNTSGLMMFAKSAAAKDTMQHNWNNMVLDRRYLAVVEGNVEEAEGECRSWLMENTQHEVYSVPEKQEGAQLAVTHWKRMARRNGYTMLEVSLDTGRKNQIRVHCKDMGHPIAGDRKYGAKSSPIHRLALHARTLRFVHPMTRRLMEFETPVPAAFAAMVH